MQIDLLGKDLNLYQHCRSGAGENNLTSALTAFVMINTDTIPSLAAKFVDSLLSHDGKNRKTVPDAFTDNSSGLQEDDGVDDYYTKALILVLNEFLNDQKDSMYYNMYAQTIAIFLISKGLKSYVDQLELPEDISSKTQQVLIELDDKVNELVNTAKAKCKELQPELYSKFLDLDVNLINENITTVIYRWFMDENGNKIINEDLEKTLQGLRAEYLRVVKRGGEVEVGLLIELFGMNVTTYTRYRKDMISRVAEKCDSSLLSYVKYMFLNKDNPS